MEGGKIVKNKIIFKSIFVCLLILILIGLIFIIFDKAGTGAHIYNPMVLNNYRIIDNTNDCDNNKYLIYSDEKNNYYLNCSNSSIFILWDDGAKDSLEFDLKINKVTMESLIEHGLKVTIDEK